MHTTIRVTGATGLAGVLAALAATLVAAALSVAITALPASAHAQLISTSPAGGATVETLPKSVTLKFSEIVRTPAFVEVTGPDGSNVATGDLKVIDENVTQPLGGPTGAGQYTLSYRITSADGHPVSGTVRFTLAEGPGAAPSSPAAAPDTSAGGFGTPQIVLLVAALAVGLGALALGTRRALRHSVAMVQDSKANPRKR